MLNIINYIIIIKREAGLLLEYFIRYKKQNLIEALKTNHSFGKIMEDIKFFTSNNFQLLYQNYIVYYRLYYHN